MPAESLLIEIGTEELPPKSLNRLRQAFAAGMQQQVENTGLTHEGVESFATPRRLAVRFKNIADRQPDQAIEKKGPAVKAAFDQEGHPTRALSGFMRSCGIESPDALSTLETDKGSWLVYRSEQPGQDLQALVPDMLNRALADLPIDRRMRWGKRRSEFVRPVHWLVCLHGATILPVQAFGLTASNQSRGHRFMSDGPFTVTHANDYVEACRSASVLADFDERRETIRGQINRLAKEQAAELEDDPALLDEVTSLVEWPVALAGSFDEDFLKVPAEVLISAMKEHQRYFHLTDAATGKLLPRFITVANLESSQPDVVIAGNERVIRPRLSDAAFFFEQDTRSPLQENLPRLSQVVFQTDLGTYLEKTERVSRLAGHIAAALGADRSLAETAGRLCKADLVSDMVIEFPDLQGVMGGYYAAHDGESNEIAKGIAQHYRPEYSGGPLPEGPIASAVALADKLDTLVGLFGINQPPTGSKDPFALRRQALGVIRICIENGLRFNLLDCLAQAASGYERQFDTAPLADYIIERLTNYYADQGISSDVVDAVVATRAADGIDLVHLDQVMQAIAAFRQVPAAEQIIAANKRVANILRQADAGNRAYQASLATDEAEQGLFQAMSTLDLTAVSSAEDKLTRLASLQSPVDRFFDEVLVMAEDEALKNNRLALLRDLRSQFLEVADFSLLQ